MYKYFGSQVSVDKGREYRPLLAMVLGFIISIVFVYTIEKVFGIAYSILILGIDLTSSYAKEVLVNDLTYLLYDMVFTSSLLYLAGRTVGKHTPGKEIMFGVIILIPTLMIHFYILMSSGAFEFYPTWYLIAALTLSIAAVLSGVESTKKM